MALSVLSAAGVVSAQKTVPAIPVTPASTHPVAVTWTPGKTYRYTPSAFNSGWVNMGADYGTATKLSATARDRSGSISALAITPTSCDAWAQAMQGMWWTLNIPHGTDWTYVQNQPCKVTVTMKYTLSSSGHYAYTVAAWGPIVGWSSNHGYPIYQYGTVVEGNQRQTATVRETFSGTVGYVFGWNYPYGWAGGYVWTESLGGQSIASASISSVVLQFN